MNVGVAYIHAPFSRGDGGAAALCRALADAGHTVEPLPLPLVWATPVQLVEQVLAMVLLRVSSLDRLIALGFPATCIGHRDKIVWQVEGGADELCGGLPETTLGDEARRAVMRAETEYLGDAARVYAGSPAIATRLRGDAAREVTVIAPPPPGSAEWTAVVAELMR